MAGTVEELPDTLRRAVEPAAARAADALTALGDEAVGPVVPALVAAARDPAAAHRRRILRRLAAEGLRAAVDPHVPDLTALLGDAEPDVRETAAFLLAGHPAHAADTLAAAHARWAGEEHPAVRGSLLLAVCALDHDAGRALIRAAVTERPAAVRAAAGLATVWMPRWWPHATVRWPQRLAEAVADAFRDGDPLAGGVWTGDARAEVVGRFAHPGTAPRAMLGLLVHSTSQQVRMAIPFTVAERNRRSRRAPARYVPVLGPLLQDPSHRVRRFAAGAVRDAGAAAALVADRLVDVVAAHDRAVAARDGVANAAEESALDALLWIDDPRWRAVLAEAWQADHTGMARTARALRHAAPAYDPALFAALTARVDVAGRHDYGHAELAWLAEQLGAWGADARPALGALTAALGHEHARDRVVAGSLCRAVAAIGGPAAQAAVPAVRTCVERGFRPYDRGQAAFALWQLTGDADPLLGIVAANLDAGDEHDPSLLGLLPQLGDAARPLLPDLRRHLSEHPHRLRSNTSIAGVLYQLDGEHTEILPVLAGALAHRQPPAQAVALAEELGARGSARLLPVLRDLQGSDIGWLRVLVAGARHRLGDAGADEVVAIVLPAPDRFEHWHHAAARPAVDLVVQARATQAVQRLEAYLATDRRIRYGGQDDLVRDDELLQVRLRAAIGTLTGAGPA